MRRDSYRGLNGLISFHGVYFPGTPLARSLSRVFGNVSGHNSRTGWFSGRVRRRVAYAPWILSRQRSAGGRLSSASSAAVRVVLNAPAIFLIAWFCSRWRGWLWVFCWFHHTSTPKSATVVMQDWYSCRNADWLRPRSVFPSRESAMKTLIAEAVRVWMWCFQLNFLSNKNPSHRWTSDGSMHVPFGRMTLT